MAKINSKIDQALRKEVIENGVLLGTVLIFGFNDNIYLYENEVYVEQFKLTDDDYVVTDFYQGSWEVINTNIYNGKFNANEPYAEALIDYMNLYNRSLYLSNKKYREIAKEQFAELKKEYEESGLLDDINVLLKKSKSKTFRYSTFESLKENRFDDLKRDIETLLLDDKVLKSLEDIDNNLELAYMLAERLDPSDYSMNSEDDLADEIKDMIVRGKIKITESKKSARKTINESMNLDYSDFDYEKFKNWIIDYLEDYGCEVNTVEIICDDYGYDVEINIENAENLPSRISDKDYSAFIFDAMYTTNCLYLKMPIVRAMKIAEEFSPKVLKVNDDSILIGDKNSDTEIWLDVWTDNDGDEDYTEWDYNQQSFNLNNYEDMVQKYLQQIDDFFYILDGEVSDTF